MSFHVTSDAVLAAVSEQVSSDLAGEAAILHLGSGVYYGLNPLGSRIWSLLQRPVTAAQIRDTLVHGYDVDPGQFEADRKSTRLNSSHIQKSRMPSSA